LRSLSSTPLKSRLLTDRGALAIILGHFCRAEAGHSWRAPKRGWIEANEGRWQDAERHYRGAISEWEAAGEGDTISVVPELSNLALLYLNQRRLADAAPLLERAWHLADTAKEATDEQRVTLMTNLGVLYTRQRRWQAAGELLRRSLEIAGAGTGVGADARRRLFETYALVLRQTGQRREAKALWGFRRS